MRKIPVALQLFAVRGEVEKDLPGTLAEVAKIGYQGAEPWGFDGSSSTWRGLTAAQLRKLYDDNGLACCGFHLSTGALLGENLRRTIEFNQALGNRFLVVAMDKQRMTSREGIDDLAKILNQVADTLKPLGMYTGYHAHAFDFDKVDGEPAWDILFSQTKSDVIMQLDTGNAANGGCDVVATLKKFPQRARSLHLKQVSSAKGAAVGEGGLDWKTIFDLVQTQQNTEWYVVEEGAEGGNGFDVPRRNLESLRKFGIV